MQYTTVLLYIIAFQIHEFEANFYEDVIDWVRNTFPEIQRTHYVALSPDEDVWHCGSTTYSISLKLSKFFVEWACEKIMDKINKACWRHDRCYEKQRGKDHCDRVFCERLDYLDRKYLPRINLCPTGNMCRAVTYFGGAAYDACRKN